MLLGLSGSQTGDGIELDSITGSEHGDRGIAHGGLLSRFAEEVHAGSDLAVIRAEVIDAVGEAGLVDAAAICANFNMMVRIADGTGTPLDEGSVEMSADLRHQLGLDELTSKRLIET